MARFLLTDKQIPKLAAGRQHADGASLFVKVDAEGRRRQFIIRYRLAGKGQTYTIENDYPKTTLQAARDENERVRGLVQQGLDPVAERRERKHATAVAAIKAREETLGDWCLKWHTFESANKATNWSAKHAKKILQTFHLHVKPWPLWKLHIAKISGAQLTGFFERMYAHSPEVARDIGGRFAKVWDYAILHGVEMHNPVPLARGVLKRRKSEDSATRPAHTDWQPLRSLLRAEVASQTHWQFKSASRLAAFTVQRVSEIVGARWDEFDLHAKEWRIGRHRMKIKDPRRRSPIVPLAPAVIELLQALPRVEDSPFLFPSPIASRSTLGHITRESLERFYRDELKATGQHSPNSWRASFSTLANDEMVELESYTVKRFDGLAVEAVLDHAMADEVRAAYERGEKKAAKRAVLEWWAQRIVDLSTR